MFHLIYWITGITFILVFGTMLVFLVMYSDRPGRRARYTHGNSTLEIVWTVIPALILVVLTFLSVPAWSKIKMAAPPPSDFVVKVTAKQFNWEITYPGADGKFGTEDDKTLLDEMHVPVNKVVHVHLRSQDVIHSFFVPQFRLKQDAVPGREIVQWFEATKAGQVRAALRRAVRLRALRHEGLGLRAHAGRTTRSGRRRTCSGRRRPRPPTSRWPRRSRRARRAKTGGKAKP